MERCRQDAGGPDPGPRPVSACSPPAGAAMRPVFWARNQPGLDRIVLDVANDGLQVSVVANLAVEIVPRPESAAATEQPIRPSRRERFPGMQ